MLQSNSMLWILNQLRKLLLAIISNDSPQQIAWGMAIGIALGLIPANPLVSGVLFLILLIVNVNIAAALLAAGTIKFISGALSPLADQIGYSLLVKTPSLTSLWTTLYNLPIVPWSQFNNTVMLGMIIIATLVLIPSYFLCKILIIAYRKHLHPILIKLKFVQALKLSKWFGKLISSK